MLLLLCTRSIIYGFSWFEYVYLFYDCGGMHKAIFKYSSRCVNKLSSLLQNKLHQLFLKRSTNSTLHFLVNLVYDVHNICILRVKKQKFLKGYFYFFRYTFSKDLWKFYCDDTPK